MVDIKLFLHKELNKFNIFQKLDFIPPWKLKQKLFLTPAIEKLITIVIFAN